MVQRHDLIDPQEQHGKQGPLFDPPHRQGSAAQPHIEGPEDPELEMGPSSV